MSRWINRFFALMTFGPILIWLGCAAAVMILSGLYGCRIDEGGVHPCTVHGIEIGETAAVMGVLATWGPLIFGPFVAVSAVAWGLFALIRHMRWRMRR